MSIFGKIKDAIFGHKTRTDPSAACSDIATGGRRYSSNPDPSSAAASNAAGRC